MTVEEQLPPGQDEGAVDPALARLVSEAKDHWRTPSIDVAEVERRSLASIARAPKGTSRRRIVGVAVAGVLALAASVALRPRPARETQVAVTPAARPDLPAGVVRASKGTVRIAGADASKQRALQVGETIDVEHGAALFERPGKVTWLLSSGAPPSEAGQATITSSRETLVVDLRAGLLEAQVTPVPAGEAFAVDVAAGDALVRIAVHGTHFRVTRLGATRVAVDLSEGVVAIGVPPAEGLTTGKRMVAPAHAEFDVMQLDATFVVEGEHVASPLTLSDELFAPPPAVVSSGRPLPSAPGVATTKPSAHPPPSNAEQVGKAVRECAVQAAKKRGSGDVHVSVTSALHLRIKANGEVESAQFVPPLLPEVQTCAAATIYKLRFEDGGPLTIPIDYAY